MERYYIWTIHGLQLKVENTRLQLIHSMLEGIYHTNISAKIFDPLTIQ
jgi:hypothetical protein